MKLRYGTHIRTRVLAVAVALCGAAAMALPVSSAAADETATVTVDAGTQLGALNAPSDNVNLSGSAFALTPPDGGPQPPANIHKLQSFPVKTARVFITPYQFYNVDEGTYDLKVSYPLLKEAGRFSDNLLVCLNPLWATSAGKDGGPASPALYETVVQKALMDYKKRFPNIEYIEPWNEPNHPNNGPLTTTEYYAYYKATYKAVNAVNAALHPTVPLKVGGPATAGFNSSFITGFLDEYAADTDPGKRLDYVSYHDYSLRGSPKRAKTQKATVAGWLSARGLNSNTPVYVTEYGLYPGGDTGQANGATPAEDLAKDQLVQAAGMASAGQYYALSGLDKPFQWVINHVSNDRKDMFVDGEPGVLTPYGHMVQMQSMWKDQRVSTTIQDGVNTNGVGLSAISTADSSGVAVMYWNYQGETGTKAYNAQITVNNLPASFAGKRIRIQRYLVDATHSNYNHSTSQTTLEKVEDLTVSGTSVTKTPGLQPNAVGIMILTPVS